MASPKFVIEPAIAYALAPDSSSLMIAEFAYSKSVESSKSKLPLFFTLCL
ncbi:MAG: hypothetical protein AAFR31_22090 [Cyanobacteria bacterium J06627_8]